MFSQSTLTVASLIALVAALPQSQTGTCPAGWGSFSTVTIGGQSVSHCCPGYLSSGSSFDTSYCCVGGTFNIPSLTTCPGYPNCLNGPTAVQMGPGPTTPGLPCQATAYFSDPNYSSIVAAVISGTAAAEVSSAVQMDSSSMAPPMASATNAGDQTQASGTAVPVATSAAAGTSPAATTADADTTAVTGQATSATTGSGSSTSSSASSSGSKGAGAQVTALPMAGALVMAAGGLVLAAL